MIKIIFTFLLLFPLLFTSCWIYPDYKNYKLKDGVYYFEDYETMKSVIIPEINKSFQIWHWNSEEFDEKYEKYFGNIDANEDDYAELTSRHYSYAVRNRASVNKSSSTAVQTKKGSRISGDYFWITTDNKKSVVFYQN